MSRDYTPRWAMFEPTIPISGTDITDNSGSVSNVSAVSARSSDNISDRFESPVAPVLPEPSPDTLDAIFRLCDAAGVHLRPIQHGGAWTFVANPRAAVSPELMAALVQHKATMLAELLRRHVCAIPGCAAPTYRYLPIDNDLSSRCELHYGPDGVSVAPGALRGDTGSA